MKIECVKEKIQEAVSKAEKVTGKNLTLPILSYIIFEATKDGLTIKATNLDVGVELTVQSKIIEEGKVAIPGSVFTALLSNLSDQKITLETKENTLTVTTATSSTTIKTVSDEDFPLIPKETDVTPFSMHSESFLEGLKSVWYAAAVSSMKPELSSVFITTKDTDVVFVATDSFRLAEKKQKMKKPTEITDMLIPVKNIPDIIKILDGINEDIQVYVFDGQMMVQTETILLISRLVEGLFPDYEKIIPHEDSTTVSVLKKDFLHGLKTANIFSNKFNQINLLVDPTKNEFICTTENSDVGENTTKIEAKTQGEKVELNFNYKYIVDSFQSIEDDSITLLFSGPTKPMIIKGVSGNNFLYLAMPMSK